MTKLHSVAAALIRRTRQHIAPCFAKGQQYGIQSVPSGYIDVTLSDIYDCCPLPHALFVHYLQS